jgi:hypothetical protein
MAEKVAGEMYEGITGQLFEIGRQLRQKNGYPYDPVKLKSALQDIIEGKMKIYTVFVDYSMSIEEMVRLGGYGSNKKITTKYFPTTRTGRASLEIELIHFDRVSFEDAIYKMNNMGYRPAELHELLAFGQTFPNVQHVQREFSIFALGSVCRHPLGAFVVALDRSGSKRKLSTCRFDSGLSNYEFVAVVRK